VRQLAQDANAFRYRDLEKLLLDLDDDRRKLTARIALTPLVEAAEAWQVLRPIMLANLDPNVLDDLKHQNVFEKDAATPRFGHATRRDAARSFLDTLRPEAIRAEAEYLIVIART
jgi:phytoene dehydrogenase-like protein